MLKNVKLTYALPSWQWDDRDFQAFENLYSLFIEKTKHGKYTILVMFVISGATANKWSANKVFISKLF